MNRRWMLLVSIVVIVMASGWFFGKMREGNYLDRLYERKDFMLLDQQGEFFHLSKMPKDKLFLLIFTPDELFPKDVRPMAEFNLSLRRIQEKKIEVIWLTRTHRDIVLNFRAACGFPGRLLIDMGGAVGKRFDIWPSIDTVHSWGYALVDSEGKIYRVVKSEKVLTTQEVFGMLEQGQSK